MAKREIDFEAASQHRDRFVVAQESTNNTSKALARILAWPLIKFATMFGHYKDNDKEN